MRLSFKLLFSLLALSKFNQKWSIYKAFQVFWFSKKRHATPTDSTVFIFLAILLTWNGATKYEEHRNICRQFE